MWTAGELDQQITIFREVRVEDGGGGFEVSLKKIATDLWAKVKPMSGRESNRFNKLNAEFTNLFVIRYYDDIKEDDRILWDGEYYNIRTILRAGTRQLYLEIYAERGVAQ